MSLRRRVSATVDAVLRRGVYGGPVARVVDALGLESALADAYWGLQLRFADDVQTLAAGGASAEFSMTTRAEFRRNFQNFEREREQIEALLADVEPDDIVWDVGASVGLYACLIADRLDDGRVICFEPNPPNVASLERNVALNEAGDIVEIHDVALADDRGTTTMLVKSDEAGESGTLAEKDWMEHAVEVAVETGDALVESGEVPPPDVVKIDVEGAELDVIRGAEDAFSRDVCRVVHCEVHPGFLPDFGGTVEDVVEAMEACGFEVQNHRGNLRGEK